MDTWTSFETVGGEEVIVRIEKDTTGDGKPDTFETYEQIAGKPTIKQRDEDKNGDGTIDIRSVYERASSSSARSATRPWYRLASCGGPGLLPSFLLLLLRSEDDLLALLLAEGLDLEFEAPEFQGLVLALDLLELAELVPAAQLGAVEDEFELHRSRGSRHWRGRSRARGSVPPARARSPGSSRRD